MAPKPKGGRATDKIGAAPPAIAVTGPKPLGVPQGYFAIGNRPNTPIANLFGKGGQMAIPPKYYDGDQFLPSSQSPAQIAELQHALEAGGWFGSKTTIVYGRWDPATAKAYEAALSTANQSGKTIQQVLNESILTTAAAGGGPKEAGPTQIPVRKISSPADLQSIFKKSAKELIGHDANQEDIDSMVLAYQALQIAPQQQAEDVQWQQAQMAEAGGGRGAPVTITEAPDPTVYAEEELKKRYPWQYAGTKGAGVAQTVEDVLYGGR